MVSYFGNVVIQTRSLSFLASDSAKSSGVDLADEGVELRGEISDIVRITETKQVSVKP
jgi:hypothetical protein